MLLGLLEASGIRERIVLDARVSYHIVAAEQDGQWIARATQRDTGRPFGIECSCATESEATDRLVNWLEWQAEHAAALEALQAAERTYPRTVAERAFSNLAPELSPAERSRPLEALEAARIALDRVRSRRPEPHS